MNWRQWPHLVVGWEMFNARRQMLDELGIIFRIEEKDITCCGFYDRDCKQWPLRKLIYKHPESGQEIVLEEYIKLDGSKGDDMIVIGVSAHPLDESGESDKMINEVWLPSDDPVP